MATAALLNRMTAECLPRMAATRPVWAGPAALPMEAEQVETLRRARHRLAAQAPAVLGRTRALAASPVLAALPNAAQP